MILLEIKKPEPEVPPVQRQAGFLERITNYAQSRGHKPSPPEARYMEKIYFAKFVEEEVKPRFKVGQLCTVKGIPFFPKRIPDPLWRVEEITEVTWMAPIDENTHQPRCVLVSSVSSGIYAPMPPNALRALHDEELTLVNFRDKAKQTREDATCEGPTGPEPSLDHADYAG